MIKDMLAKEALKPASSIIDAMLAPKVRRIADWAASRDVRAAMESEVLRSVLEAYLRRVFRRVSGITTMVFPQQTLPLPAVYEPLTIRERFRQLTSAISYSEMIRERSRYFLIDGAGMGKSTFLKSLVAEVILSSDRVPFFIELRKLSVGSSLTDAMVAELDDYANSFDRTLFGAMLATGNFFIVLDGFDEVGSADRRALAREIEILATNCERSTIIVSSRPEALLPEMPDARVMGIAPLTRAQAESLIRRYDRLGDAGIADRLISELAVVSPQLLNVPLLVAMLYRTYGFNGAISTRISSFYDEVYNAFYKGHDLSKASLPREKRSGLDFEDFRRLLRSLAFLMISQETISLRSDTVAHKLISKATKIAQVGPTSAASVLDDLLLAVPLMVRDGLELRFLHKTLLEYFAAEFVVSSKDSEKLIEAISKPQMLPRFSGTFDFIADIDPPFFKQTVGVALAEAFLAYAESTQGFNDVLRTSTFVRESRVGLWPYSEVVEIIAEQDPHITLPRAGPEFRTTAYAYGTLDGERYIFAATTGEHRRHISQAAWNLLAVKSIPVTTRFVDLDFTGLSSLPRRRWIELTDPAFVAVSHDDIPVHHLLWSIAPPSSSIADLKRRGTPGVFTVESAKALLAEVEQQRTVRGWLVDFLGSEDAESDAQL